MPVPLLCIPEPSPRYVSLNTKAVIGAAARKMLAETSQSAVRMQDAGITMMIVVWFVQSNARRNLQTKRLRKNSVGCCWDVKGHKEAKLGKSKSVASNARDVECCHGCEPQRKTRTPRNCVESMDHGGSWLDSPVLY